MNAAIRVDRLSKVYQLGADVAPYRTVRESLTRAVAAPFRNLRRIARGDMRAAPQVHWALQDVSFDVDAGEVVGIIGRNGAGKSTLLKVLSQITEPTTGRVELRGRVGSLLEVGTGFHPELTGRENIFLSGAILGMTRRDIVRRFDEIVAFADIGPFLDTPVKRYSSGMHVRLGFAVSAHLEPDILFIDEVLAVGDVAFQQKCIGRIGEVGRSGRTVLFVSHNMGAVNALCTRALLLDAGRIAADGRVEQVVEQYLRAARHKAATGAIPDDTYRIGTGTARFRTREIRNSAGAPTTSVYFGEALQVVCTVEVFAAIPDAVWEVSLSTLDGTHVSFSTNVDRGSAPWSLAPGRHDLVVELENHLLPRSYSIDLGLHHLDGTTIDLLQSTIEVTVLNVSPQNPADYHRWLPVRGLVRLPGRWTRGAASMDETAAAVSSRGAGPNT